MSWKASFIIIIMMIVINMVQLVMCRLDMLGRLCTTWHGWVSAAVYLPLDPQSYSTHVHTAVARLDRLHADLEPGQPNNSNNNTTTIIIKIIVVVISTHVHTAVARLDELHADLEPGQPSNDGK